MFALHRRLAVDVLPLGRLRLSLLLLMNDATYPWFILVPEREDAREIFELAEADRLMLIEEIVLVSRAVSQAFRPDKLNVAALGNIVPQLHVHVIARFRSDPAWPAPVWGRTEAHRGGQRGRASSHCEAARRRAVARRLAAARPPPASPLTDPSRNPVVEFRVVFDNRPATPLQQAPAREGIRTGWHVSV